MKNKLLKCFIVSTLAIMLLACGKQEVENTVELQVEENEPTELPEEIETDSDTEVEPEPVMMQTYYVEVSDLGYSSLRCIGEGLYCFYDDETEKCGVIDVDGNVLKDSDYNYINASKDGNYIIASKVIDGGFFSELYDSQLNLLWTNEGYTNFIIYDYSDGVAHLVDPEKSKHAFFDILNGAAPLFELSPENNQDFVAAFGCRGDFIPLEIRALYENGFLIGIDKERNDIVSPDINGKTFSPGAAMSSDGWMFGILVGREGDGAEFVFYNYLTGEVVSDPTEDHKYSQFKENGAENCLVIDGKAFHIVNYETEGEDPYSTYEVFDLKTQSFIGEFKYAFVSHDNIKLVQTMDDKWTYTDENYSQISEYYEGACVFGDDYALVVIDGKVNVINRDFENITDASVEVDATSVAGMGFNSFVVGKDDLYYMAKIVEGTPTEVK